MPDVSLFELADAVYGPLEVILMKAGKFDVPEYKKVVEHFNVVKYLERNSLLRPWIADQEKGLEFPDLRIKCVDGKLSVDVFAKLTNSFT